MGTEQNKQCWFNKTIRQYIQEDLFKPKSSFFITLEFTEKRVYKRSPYLYNIFLRKRLLIAVHKILTQKILILGG